MKYRIVYQTKELYFEAEAVNEQERKDIVKGLIYTATDLTNSKLINNTFNNNYVDQNEIVQEDVQPQQTIEYASESQKKYMAKLGIPFNENTTKIEAIDLINNYKIVHGIPLNKKN